jgi:hypothetical protein
MLTSIIAIYFRTKPTSNASVDTIIKLCTQKFTYSAKEAEDEKSKKAGLSRICFAL